MLLFLNLTFFSFEFKSYVGPKKNSEGSKFCQWFVHIRLLVLEMVLSDSDVVDCMSSVNVHLCVYARTVC